MNSQAFYTSTEAAKVLGLSERRVRQLVSDGILEAERDGHAWKLFRYSVHNYRDEHGVPERSPDTPQWPIEAREALDEVKDLTLKLGRMEGRLELEAVARSTLEAQLRREQELLDQERQRMEQERKERVAAQEENLRLREDLQAERSKGFWQRIFRRE